MLHYFCTVSPFHCMKKRIGICGANPFIVMFIESDSIENVAQAVKHAFLG